MGGESNLRLECVAAGAALRALACVLSASRASLDKVHAKGLRNER